MLKPLVFLGSSTAMQLYIDAAHSQGLSVAGIIDSDYWGNTDIFAGQLVIGSEKEFKDEWRDQYEFFIGTNWSPDPDHSRDRNKRKYLIDLVEQLGITCINLIDPNCYIGANVSIGQGCYIAYNTYIEFDNTIDSFCQIHFNTGISHGCSVGKNTVIRQRAGLANANIGNDVYIGTGTNMFTSAKRLQVGNGAIINQGLWVMRDVEPGEHVRLTPGAVRTYRNYTEV
jgi:acetyltransferase-like isoleucine patch superfamily enzyme